MELTKQLKDDLQGQVMGRIKNKDIEFTSIKKLEEEITGTGDNTYITRAKARKQLINLRDRIEGDIISIHYIMEKLDESNVKYERKEIGTTEILDTIQDLIFDLQNTSLHSEELREGKALVGISDTKDNYLVEFDYKKVGEIYNDLEVVNIDKI